MGTQDKLTPLIRLRRTCNLAVHARELSAAPSAALTSLAFRSESTIDLLGQVYRVRNIERGAHAKLLEDFGELAGGLQERELTLLAGEICVEEGHPFVAFLEAYFLDVAKGCASLIEFGL